MPDEESLLLLAAAVLDGRAVDWSKAEANFSDEGELLIVRQLRIVAGVVSVHWSQPLSSPHIGATSPSQTAATTVRMEGLSTLSDPYTPESHHMIGDYLLVRKLGKGGMGVVYEAEQQHPKRAVAVKVIRGGRHVDDNHVRMFRREAQTLARLKHPSIAAIYESGRTEDGQHYFAMELVRGETLDRHLVRRGKSGSPTPAEVRYRLQLFRRICEAVVYAHQRGVIHRDLKPSNIIVTSDSPAGHSPLAATLSSSTSGPEIKILDFGLARITDVDLAISSVLTDLGQVQGTLAYMSPEQVRGNPDEIDMRSDIYSLGVMLYEALAGRRPSELARLSLPEAARVICEQPAKPISQVWRGTHRLDADVATIVSKAIEKEPARRYQSASAMAEDIERYLTDQPILARPPSTLYQLRKLMARNRAAVVFATSALVLLIGLALTMTVQAGRIARERDRANSEKARASEQAETAREVSEFLVGLFQVSDPSEAKGNNITAREILDRGSAKIDRELSSQPLVQARLLDTMGNVYRSLGLYAQAEPLVDKALGARENALPPQHPDVAQSLTSKAILLRSEGRIGDALPLFRRALEINQNTPDREELDIGWSLYNLGSTLSEKGDIDEAKILLERALTIFEKSLGLDHYAVAWCLNDIAASIERAGDSKRAAPLYERALMIKEKHFGSEHPDVALSLNNVGSIYTSVGDYDKAMPLLERALAIYENVSGPDHPDTARARGSLGELLRRIGRNTEARSVLEKTLDAQERTLNPAHIDLAYTLTSLALALEELGESGLAEVDFRRALAIRESALPPSHPIIADILEEYASFLRRVGREREAVPLEARARAIRSANILQPDR